MSKEVEKRDFPVSDIRRYLEPGPIVLVSSKMERQDEHLDDGLARRDGVYAVARRLRDRRR